MYICSTFVDPVDPVDPADPVEVTATSVGVFTLTEIEN